ncbi:MAG: hypothetical protein FJ035_00230 [Chloroflexi bacterium]|nr:hypothetical protein [Chloroflexota bacterium]
MTTDLAVGFDDMVVLSEGGVDVFVLNLDADDEVPPYYIDVAGRRFAFSAVTFLVRGHSAQLAQFIREHEADGRLVLLGERRERYLAYVYDPTAETDEDDE